MKNPWLIAFTGIGQTILFLGTFLLVGITLRLLARKILGLSEARWKQVQLERFWLINAIFAPVMLVLFAIVIRLLQFTPSQVGFNFHNWGISLGIAVPLALALGTPSALVAPTAVKQGLTPMKIPFGRTLVDTIGAIGYAALLVGPLEEIPFRGIIQTLLGKDMPQALNIGAFHLSLGVFLSVLIFVFYHIRNVFIGGESMQQFFRLMPGRTVVSLIIAMLFDRTGSLLGPILFHNIVDTCTITALSVTMYRMRQRGEMVDEPTSNDGQPASQVR